MKPLICEMCNSHDLVKNDGVFVCQHCGTKYSVEEARKMMFGDGSSPTETVVQIDNSGKLEKLYQIARRAKEDHNTASAGKYYDMILQEDPMSWEASFFTTYYASIQTNIAGIQSAAITLSNCIHSVLKLIDKSTMDTQEKKNAIREITGKLQSAAAMFYRASIKHYVGISERIRSQYTHETYSRTIAAVEMLFNLGNEIDIVFGHNKNLRVGSTIAWEAGLKLLKEIKKLNCNIQELTKIEQFYTDRIIQYDDDENYSVKSKNIQSQIDECTKIIENTPKVHRRNLILYIFSIIVSSICVPMALDDGDWGFFILLLFVGAVVGFIYELSQKENVQKKVSDATNKRDALEAQLSAITKKHR